MNIFKTFIGVIAFLSMADANPSGRTSKELKKEMDDLFEAYDKVWSICYHCAFLQLKSKMETCCWMLLSEL